MYPNDVSKGHPAPFASLTMVTTLTRPTGSSAAAPRSVPALPNRPGSTVRPTQQQPRTATARSVPSSTSSSARQSDTQQQEQRGGLKPWKLPLAFGLVAFRIARAATLHVLPILAPAARPTRPAAVGDMRVFPSLLPKRISGGSSGRPGLPGGRKPAVVWFRNDLRLHDHEPLAAASNAATSILPVYIFDPREYGKTPNGFDKTGPYRAKFILEALHDLRTRLRQASSDLLIRIGKPEEVLKELVCAVGAGAVYCHGEVTTEEAQVEQAVGTALDKAGAMLKVSWGGTLFHVDDLPFKLSSMPPNYSDFKQALHSKTVREPVEVPTQLKNLPAASVPAGDMPTLQQLGFDAATLQRCANDTNAAAAHLRGGESEALQRLSDFITRFKAQQQPTVTQNSSSSSSSSSDAPTQSAAPNFCCKISPWLALGCLSPRQLYAQLQQQAGGQQRAQDGDTGMQWLLFELLWRDFFRFITKKYAVTGLAQKMGAGPVLKGVPAAPALAAC